MLNARRLPAAGVLFAGLLGGAAYGWPRSNAETPAAGAPAAEAAPVPPAPPEPSGLQFAGRSDAAVELKWGGPSEVKVNRPHAYSLTATNVCGQPLQNVTLQVRVPEGASATDARPAPKGAGEVWTWDLGTLNPRQSKAIGFDLASPKSGDMTCRAWVTFTGTAAMTVAVREPKLDLALCVPENVALGDPFQIRYAVSNPGDVAAEKVTVSVFEPAGFATAAEPASIAEPYDLAPAAKKVTARGQTAAAPGEYTYEVRATCPDGQAVTAFATVRVRAPNVGLGISGPAEVGLNRRATYTVTATNVGDLVAENVSVGVELGAGLQFRSSSYPPAVVAVQADGSRVKAVDDTFTLKPGESKAFTVDALATRPGDAACAVWATAKRNPKTATECRTAVRGVPGIRMEVADLTDPVERGQEATYEVRVSNTGSETDANLRVVCTLPPQLSFVEASGPVAHAAADGTVTFEPIRELGPKAEVVLRVKARAIGTGNTRFRASLTSNHLVSPVQKEESTTIYGE